MRESGAHVVVAAVAVSLLVHGALAATPLLLRRPPHTRSHLIRFKVLSPRPPAAAKVAPPPRTRPRAVRRRRRPKRLATRRPVPEQPKPSAPPAAPPVFGATKESVTSGDSSFAVPLGNTVATDPGKRGVVKPGRPAAPAPSPDPGPAPVAVKVRIKPKLLGEVKVPYPRRARSLGVEGTVKLRVLVGVNGAVERVQVVSGPGFGLNEASRRALLQFKFKPAVGTDGKPRPCWITYRYSFQIDD